MKKERDKRPTLIDNRYKTLKKLGTGSMGDVYKVRDLKDKKIIALKILSSGRTSSETIQHFKREFRLIAGLHHPSLCSVYDFGILRDGRSYFTMEYINGKDIFRATKGLPYKKIYPWVVQLCRVLEYIHSKGLVHYDIKPGNVLIAKGKEQGAESKKPYAQSPVPCVKLMDFGLAGEQRIKGGELIRGTFPYIAPEVIKGLAIDHRADLYSLGILLYGMFTRKPFQKKKRDSFAKLLKQMIDRVYEPPSEVIADIPKRLERLILRLFAFEPSERLSRANEVIKEINKIAGLKFKVDTGKTLEAYLLSSRFVGRNKEMGLLKSYYEKVRKGEGKVILVTGNAGIGKSRLLKEFKILTQLRRSHSLIGYTYKDNIRPLEPFYDIFSELINYIRDGSELKLPLAVLFKMFPDLADGDLRKGLPKLVPLGPKQEQLRTFEALSELIGYCAAGLGGLVILLEDLHWASNLSIQFLEYLGRNLARRNILICGTCRKEELKDNLVLKRMLTNLRSEGFLSQVEVRPLTFRSLYSFLDSTITPSSNSTELVRYLMKRTGGNPFFVEEIMRTLLRKSEVNIGERVEIEDLKEISIPETIEDVVLKRIKDLDSSSRKVIKFAAVLLKDFKYDLMKRLTGLDDTELLRVLWELKRRQVLIEEDNTYRFYHTALREAINKRLGDKERSDLNCQIGKTLEKINRGRLNKIVEDLAYYFINAKDHKKGVRYGLRAAKKSSEKYVNEQSIRFYKGVLGLLNYKDLKRKFDILQKLAQIEVLADYYDNAIKHFNKALSLRTGAVGTKVKIYLGIGAVYARKGEYSKALHVYRRGIRFLKKLQSGKLKALLEANIAVRICKAYLIIGDYKSANKFNFDTLKFPKEGLKEKAAIRLLADIYSNTGAIEIHKGYYGKMDYDKAISYYNEAYKYYKKIKAENKIAAALHNLGICYDSKDDYQKAFDCYQKAIQISEKVGDQHGVSMHLLNLGIILRDKGYYSKALNCFQKALSISKKIGNPSMIGGALLGVGACFLELCNYRKAKEYSMKALKIFDTIGWEEKRGFLIRSIGNVYKAMGDYTRALRFYRKALKIFREIKNQRKIAYTFINISSVFIEIGEFSRGKRYIEDALKIANTIGTKEIESECYIILCRINIIMKDYAVANDYCEKGIEIVKKLGMRKHLLKFFLLVAEIYYHEKRYFKGIKIANKSIKLAKEMGTKDLHAEALLLKAKNGVKQGSLSKVEVTKTFDEAKRIAEEIGSPEVLWKIYFEYGRFLKDDKQYHRASKFYKKCIEVYRDVISRIKSESFKRCYLNRPDRREVFTTIVGI